MVWDEFEYKSNFKCTLYHQICNLFVLLCIFSTENDLFYNLHSGKWSRHTYHEGQDNEIFREVLTPVRPLLKCIDIEGKS